MTYYYKDSKGEWRSLKGANGRILADAGAPCAAAMLRMRSPVSRYHDIDLAGGASHE
jgi:hypothetical protein